jgi:uncharacterized membrane protein YhdT
MGLRKSGSTQGKTLGIVLIIVVGLLNFHLPHFLLEPTKSNDPASFLLELVLLMNVLGALIAALGIYRDRRWGWLLGIFIVGVSVLLYLAQETVGLPGLPKMWLEPSRIVALLVEGLFILLARSQVGSSNIAE